MHNAPFCQVKPVGKESFQATMEDIAETGLWMSGDIRAERGDSFVAPQNFFRAADMEPQKNFRQGVCAAERTHRRRELGQRDPV